METELLIEALCWVCVLCGTYQLVRDYRGFSRATQYETNWWRSFCQTQYDHASECLARVSDEDAELRAYFAREQAHYQRLLNQTNQ